MTGDQVGRRAPSPGAAAAPCAAEDRTPDDADAPPTRPASTRRSRRRRVRGRDAADPRRGVPDGVRPALPRGAAGAPRPGGRVPDRRHRRHQRRLRRLRRGDGLRHGRRAPARPRALPRRAPRRARAGLPGVPRDGRARRHHRLPQLVDLDAGGVLEAPGGARQHRRRPRGAPRGPGRLRGRRGLRRLGRHGAADGGGVGARRPRRPRGRGVRLGGASRRRAAPTSPTPGRARSPGGTSPPTASPAPARSGATPRTATACSRSAATSGSGRRTGGPRATRGPDRPSPPAAPRRIRAARRWRPPSIPPSPPSASRGRW